MTCSRSTFLRVALPGATAVFALRPAFAQAGVDPSQFSGRYKYAGGRSQREKLEQQIEQVVAQLNFMIRGMARSRMRDGLAPAPHIEFAFSSDAVVFRRPEEPTIRGPLDGTPIDWKNKEREPIKVRLTFRDQTLRIRYEGDGSDSRYSYSFRDEGKRLDIRAAIDHVRMPSTLKYGLTYKRA